MNRSNLFRALAVAAALSCPLAAGAALIVPVSQTRTVSASAQITGGPLVSSSFSASDFGVFDQAAGATSVHPAGPGWYVSTGVGQTSTIGDDFLSAHLEIGFGWPFGAPGGTAQTQSIFDVTFDLLEPANFQLGNGKDPNSFGSGTHAVTLRNELGQVIAQPFAGHYFPHGSDDLTAWFSVASGVLAPGRYRLTAEWNQGFPADPGTWDAAAVLLLTPIPEPGTALLLALGLGALAASARLVSRPARSRRARAGSATAPRAGCARAARGRPGSGASGR